MPGKKGSRWSSAEEIAEIRRLRSLGKTFDEIVEATGKGYSTIHRFASDIVPPKKAVATKTSISRFERAQRRATRDEKQDAVNWPVRDDDDPMADFTPREMPTDPSDFDVDGLWPDPRLVDWSARLLRGWDEDRARGVAYERRPPAVSQALLVVLADNRIWLWEDFLRDRPNWKTVRQLARVGTTELGERVGIGMSSVSRYESNTRQPDPGLLRTLHAAYTGMLEEATSKTELALAYDSAFEHFTRKQGVPLPEVEVDGDEILRWIAGIEAESDQGKPTTIDHLTWLAHIRSMLPRPDHRGDEIPFGYLGYPTPTETEEEE